MNINNIATLNIVIVNDLNEMQLGKNMKSSRLVQYFCVSRREESTRDIKFNTSCDVTCKQPTLLYLETLDNECNLVYKKYVKSCFGLYLRTKSQLFS